MRPRGVLTFDKAPLTPDELLGLFMSRGLQVPDRDRARRYLRHIGYYRLSPYAIPFQQGEPTTHSLRTGTSFDDLLDLYVFDRALRLVVMDAIERVEVAVRASLTDHMSTTQRDPHWYTNPSHFRDRARHAGLLRIVRDTCHERLRGSPEAGDDSLVHRSALEHYLTKYGSPELPPSWLMGEMLSIGQLAAAYRKPQAEIRQDRDREWRGSYIAPSRVLALYIRAGKKHLRPSWAPVERWARRLPGNPDVTHG